mgnify:CR=1 FL=1
MNTKSFFSILGFSFTCASEDSRWTAFLTRPTRPYMPNRNGLSPSNFPFPATSTTLKSEAELENKKESSTTVNCTPLSILSGLLLLSLLVLFMTDDQKRLASDAHTTYLAHAMQGNVT